MVFLFYVKWLGREIINYDVGMNLLNFCTLANKQIKLDYFFKDMQKSNIL